MFFHHIPHHFYQASYLYPSAGEWLLQNLIGILGIVVGGFIAYHVFFLSQRINLKDKLAHKDEVRKRVEPILNNISKGRNSDIELINVKKYLKHYPHNNELTKHGYTYIKGELKALCFNGVELFCGVRELYKKQNGNLTLKNGDGTTKESYNVLEVGLIPYEWIEYVDHVGDEFSYRPQFFVRFKGLKKYPYKYLTYYIVNTTYRDGADPWDMKWTRIDIDNDA
jgi:hypothetical protein